MSNDARWIAWEERQSNNIDYWRTWENALVNAIDTMYTTDAHRAQREIDLQAVRARISELEAL